ncbi:MAG: ribonuclease III [Phycisphaerales bacterium]|nr:ribonuclease III [Phycisphaerales bacterium]
MTDVARAAAEKALGYVFKDAGLLAQALRHASIAEARVDSNERMEFLGDSVLGFVVSQRVYERFPALLEGEMTKIKSAAVSRATCALIARSLGLDELLSLGKGMQAANGHPGGGGSTGLPQSLAAAAFESLIAAIYLDGGMRKARRFILPLIDPLLDRAAASGHQENYKSVLQQHAQSAGLGVPQYRVLDEKGPDHAKCFKIGVELGQRKFDPFWGQSKKQGEQMAALAALTELGVVEKSSDGLIRVVAKPA